MTSQHPVEHDSANQRYLLRIGEGHDDNEVVLRYQRPDADSIDFTSTFTPPPLRGQGLARQVVEHALDAAQADDLNIIATCWYVEKVLKERAQA